VYINNGNGDHSISLDPKYTGTCTACANCSDLNRAIADFDEAIHPAPKDTNAPHNRGNSYGDKGDRNRAIADYDEAMRLATSALRRWADLIDFCSPRGGWEG
jgi:tetratricopeptide (TPR) repeat protein